MGMKAGYLVELDAVQFDEDTRAAWIQAMTIGKYYHPVHGEIELTPERIQQFAANVNSRVRTTDLDIDYDHKAYGGEAAGWIKRAEVRDTGLWVLVEWTKRAYSLLKEKAYRYFSPEFVDEWEDPRSGEKFTDVLFGGGITNRPFLKDILPINMSEVLGPDVLRRFAEGGKSMEEQIKQLAKLFGLDEDASLDQILGAAQVKLKVPGNEDPNDPADPDSGAGEKPAGEEDDEDEKKKKAPQMNFSEDSALKQLAETNPVVKALMEQAETQAKLLADHAVKLREAEVDKSVTRLSERASSKKFAIAPVARDAIRKALVSAPVQLNDTLVQAFEHLIDGNLVSLEEKGHERNETESAASKRFTDAVTDYVKKNNVTYSEAVSAVSLNDPELYDAYRNGTTD